MNGAVSTYVRGLGGGECTLVVRVDLWNFRSGDAEAVLTLARRRGPEVQHVTTRVDGSKIALKSEMDVDTQDFTIVEAAIRSIMLADEELEKTCDSAQEQVIEILEIAGIYVAE